MDTQTPDSRGKSCHDEYPLLLVSGFLIAHSAMLAGWLVSMACNERSIDAFVGIHNNILDVLKVRVSLKRR